MSRKPESILIVESQSLLLATLSAAISAEGMIVLAEVTDSRNAVPTAKKLNPDMILFSVGIPSLDDLQRITTLRQELPSTLIVALVSGEFRGQVPSALEHGAHAALTKYMHSSEIVSSLKRLR